MSDLFVFICTKSTADVSVPTRAANQDEFNRRLSGAFAQVNDGRLQVGDLKLRPTGDAIRNHLLCDGTAVPRAQFPQLFAYLGTSQGEGDGTTTFNLPSYLAGALTVPETAPAQEISEAGTVASEGQTVIPPADVGQSRGGNVVSGGRRQRITR
jgi:hypothetical protein